jgi:hypothetical protein
LLERSEEFDDAYWTKTNATILANQIISPDGTLTADGIITTGSPTQLGRFINLTSGIPYTLSVFAKKNTSETLQLVIDINGGAGLFSFFNLNTGTVTTTGAGVTRAAISDVGNGWYRCLVVATTTTVGNTPTIRGSGIYIWGAQLESGAFASPYTPTVASQVTRVADSAVMTGVNFSSWFNPEQGCFYVQGSSNNTTNGRYLMTTATAGDNRFMVYTDGASVITGSVITNGATQALLSRTGLTITNNNAFALSYNTDDFKAVGNGGVVGTDTAGVVPVANTLFIGQRETGSAQISGYIRRLTYYPQALTSANLQAVTR